MSAEVIDLSAARRDAAAAVDVLAIPALIDVIARDIDRLVRSELEAARAVGALFGQDPGNWIHTRGEMIEDLIRATSQTNRARP